MKIEGSDMGDMGINQPLYGDVMGMLHLNGTMGPTTMNPGGPVLDERTG